MNEKERRLAEYCRKRGLEGAWLRRRTNIAWLTDGADVHVDASSSTGVAGLLWTPRRKVVLTTNIEAPRLAAEEFGDGWEVRPHEWWTPAPRPEGRYATDFPDDPFADLRAPLTDLELRRIRDFGRFSGAALAATMKALKPGWTEHEAAADLQARFRREGAQVPVLLVAADERIARFRHPIPTSRRIRKTVMIAITPRRHGLMVALTRLVHFGRELPPALRRKHEAVCAVDRALHAATSPGVRWCDALQAGIEAYRAAGFGDEWTRHHQGGPVGYEGREFKATPAETRRILERQAVAWNPSIAGTKSEDTILGGGGVITPTPGWPERGGRPDILLRRG